jgi:flavodoxin
MMTRKDYVETAKILNKFVDDIDSNDFDQLVFEFSEWFASDNPRFDESKFYDACVDGIAVNA